MVKKGEKKRGKLMIFREQRKAIWNIKDVFFRKIVKSYQFSLPEKSCPMHGWERISKWFSERDWFLQDSKTCQLAFPSGFLRYPIDLLWLNTTYYDDSPSNLSLVHTVFEPFNFYIFQISFCDVLWALHTQQWRKRKRWAKKYYQELSRVLLRFSSLVLLPVNT